MEAVARQLRPVGKKRVCGHLSHCLWIECAVKEEVSKEDRGSRQAQESARDYCGRNKAG